MTRNNNDKSNSASYKHLTRDERLSIETALNLNTKLCDIASSLDKDPTTISKEIKKHRILDVRSNAKNPCGNQLSCQRKNLCNKCGSGLCKFCTTTKCSTLCSDFIETPTCKRTIRFPYVCNACEKKDKCKSPKLFYNHYNAHDDYEAELTNSRKGYKYTASALDELSKVVLDGVKRGLSLDIIVVKNGLNIAPSTLYRYIDEHRIHGVKNIDLKRKVRYTHKPKKPKNPPINYDYLKGREYYRFTGLALDNPHANIWEMDTIEGKKGTDEKAVLSLLHRQSNLQLFFILKTHTQIEVELVFKTIKSTLGEELFTKYFEIILTDNGNEFKNPIALESSIDGDRKLISIYYCEPKRSDQKGKCEKNHEHFREFIPKGISFKPYTDKDMNYISKNINNYPRAMHNFCTPLEMARPHLHDLIYKLNDINELSHDKVVMKLLLK